MANRLVAKEQFGNMYRQLSAVRASHGEADSDPLAMVEGTDLEHMLGLARAWADHSQPELPTNQIPVLNVCLSHAALLL